jgi:hypothetical protein
MVAYKEDNERQEGSGSSTFDAFEKTKTFLSAWFGVILTVLAIVIIFVVAALEGAKEVRASNSDSGKLLNMWRESAQVQDGFPEEKVVIIEYRNREYYFIIEEVNEQGDIVEWYWAYDGGIDYIFSDYKYYVLVSITFVFSIFVSSTNYNSTVEKAIGTEKFKNSLLYYQEQKTKVQDVTHLIPRFCVYKNKQTFEDEKRNVIEKADVNFEKFINNEIPKETLTKWQKKQIKKVKKIKIVRIQSSDLLQEKNFSNRKIRILAEGQAENRSKFLWKTAVSKLISTALSGLVAGFGVVIGNYVLGLVFGGIIVASAIGSIIAGADYGTNTLKNRFIGKGDLLIEFFNMKERFIQEEKEEQEARELAKKKALEAIQAKDKKDALEKKEDTPKKYELMEYKEDGFSISHKAPINDLKTSENAI